MAQLPCIGLSWPLTKPPFGSCAIYFRHGVGKGKCYALACGVFFFEIPGTHRLFGKRMIISCVGRWWTTLGYDILKNWKILRYMLLCINLCFLKPKPQGFTGEFCTVIVVCQDMCWSTHKQHVIATAISWWFQQWYLKEVLVWKRF